VACAFFGAVALYFVGPCCTGSKMSQTLLFNDAGEPTLEAAGLLPNQLPNQIREQLGAGMVNKAIVHRNTKPLHSGQRLRILKHIEKMADCGATRDEIADSLGLPVSTVCGRVNELLDPRWPDVVETDQRRNTRYGKPAVVLVAKTEASSERREAR
jgi:hypothetical protein